MSRDTVHLTASVLLLLALALLVAGLSGGRELLWRIGLGVVAVALAFSFATRWVRAREDEDRGEPPSGERPPVGEER